FIRFLASYSSSFFFFSCYADHRALHSFPTRRSSDLDGRKEHQEGEQRKTEHGAQRICIERHNARQRALDHAVEPGRPVRGRLLRSEEHTSELQSRSDLVCRLLLEKKKKTKTKTPTHK